MAIELPKTYEPDDIQNDVAKRWADAKAFAALPDGRGPDQRYVIMMPLPNVTGALHMGHAMDNVMQDMLIRWHRMRGDNTLWQPGTDHAGIATQAVIEKRLLELEGKTRHDIGREALVAQIWRWKDEFQQRIVAQQKQMGCSCDWDRQRFTMDAVCGRAVREVFFRLFCDRLIYRGDRLVNWDCQLQTAVADDEVYHETVAGHFWHLRYPVVNPKPGEPKYVVVATTRPETMLGDTAVACHPDPAAALDEAISAQKKKVAEAPAKERPLAEEELTALEERKRTHLPLLVKLAAMARDGRKVLLPLQKREIKLIVDEWAKPELGSGCVKITPGHDPNDYDVWRRHADEIGLINILEPNGKLNSNAGAYAGLDRMVAREKVVADLKAQDLIEAIEDREIEVGHSDRSKTPVEPYVSRQWFVRMGDVEGGVVCGQGTPREFRVSGLAQAAIDAVLAPEKTPTKKGLRFHPERYSSGYVNWLSEKRDWCVSRQLWWGHSIPVWSASFTEPKQLLATLDALAKIKDSDVRVWVTDAQGQQFSADEARKRCQRSGDAFEIQVCLRNKATDDRHRETLTSMGLKPDEDVLDTWFSSALWPFSTLGWPDPATAPIDPGQAPLGPMDGRPDSFSYYYPGSCLVTARDIISLWVARMLIMGLYNHGEVPFTDCFVHAKILDGKGVTMSKSKGNGIDPVDIIKSYGADAMRYIICDMETGIQDVRLPVQAVCPSCKTVVELTDAKHGRTIFTYKCTSCKTEFDVLGTMADVPAAKVTSDRFEVGRSFCNKLWNAARFALMNLGDLGYKPLAMNDLAAEDRWILSRLNATIKDVNGYLEAYQPSSALGRVRDFFWGDLCDWYLELVKPRMRDEAQAPVARQVLATALDQVLRLLHVFVPFITEAIWSYLNAQAKERGIEKPLSSSELCIKARWPEPHASWANAALEAEFTKVQEVIGRLRELRSRHDVPPRKELPAAVRASGDLLAVLGRHAHLIKDMAKLSELVLGEQVEAPKNAATQVTGGVEVFLGDVLDPERERARLTTRLTKLTADLTATQKKLANKGFVERAPADVVATERQRAVELESQLAVVQKSLQALEA